MSRAIIALFVFICIGLGLPAAEPNPVKVSIAQHLQNTSVTIKAGPYSGSGSLVQTKDGRVWAWTAAHVVKVLRKTKEGEDKKIKVEFDDAQILRFNRDKDTGRIVSSFNSDAEIIRYSDPEEGFDLCLLRIRDKGFKPAGSTQFYLDKDAPELGTELYHVGSLLGTFGSNSMTSGIMSQHGRLIEGKLYDQVTCTCRSGSSGGIVCLKSDGRYVGMLVMSAGEGFGLMVPVRVMSKWAKDTGIEFAVDNAKEVPTDDILLKDGLERTSVKSIKDGK